MQKIFVGDVQGCGDELDELLERATNRMGAAFEIWQVGDLVNRGPYNVRVIKRMMALDEEGRARCVLGNHEIALLRAWLGLGGLKESDSASEVLRHPRADRMLEWIRRRPLAITGRIGQSPFAMVHASVHPDWSLLDLERRARDIERRLRSKNLDDVRELLSDSFCRDPALLAARDDLGRLTRCRSVANDGAWSSALPAGGFKAWHSRWSSRGHGYGIIYGHWALQGLHVADGLRGLDTGCVHHGRTGDRFLTAWLPEGDDDARKADAFRVPDDRFWEVPARQRYTAGPGASREEKRDSKSSGSSRGKRESKRRR